MSHVKQKRSESRPVSTDSREKELDKTEEADKVPIRITIKADSPGVGTQPNCGSRPTQVSRSHCNHQYCLCLDIVGGSLISLNSAFIRLENPHLILEYLDWTSWNLCQLSDSIVLSQVLHVTYHINISPFWKSLF